MVKLQIKIWSLAPQGAQGHSRVTVSYNMTWTTHFILSEVGNCSVCQVVGKTSATDTAHTQKPVLYMNELC